jgi:hypothetical protein
LPRVCAGKRNEPPGRPILELARSHGVLRTPDVDSAGASHALLASLTDQGRLLKGEPPTDISQLTRNINC